MASPDQITVSQLSRLIGRPDAPVLVDICIDEDFAADPRFIPGAFRHSFTNIEELVPVLSGRKVVVVCQKGLKLSQGAAALLRSHPDYAAPGVFVESVKGLIDSGRFQLLTNS